MNALEAAAKAGDGGMVQTPNGWRYRIVGRDLCLPNGDARLWTASELARDGWTVVEPEKPKPKAGPDPYKTPFELVCSHIEDADKEEVAFLTSHDAPWSKIVDRLNATVEAARNEGRRGADAANSAGVVYREGVEHGLTPAERKLLEAAKARAGGVRDIEEDWFIGMELASAMNAYRESGKASCEAEPKDCYTAGNPYAPTYKKAEAELVGLAMDWWGSSPLRKDYCAELVATKAAEVSVLRGNNNP